MGGRSFLPAGDGVTTVSDTLLVHAASMLIATVGAGIALTTVIAAAIVAALAPFGAPGTAFFAGSHPALAAVPLIASGFNAFLLGPTGMLATAVVTGIRFIVLIVIAAALCHAFLHGG